MPARLGLKTTYLQCENCYDVKLLGFQNWLPGLLGGGRTATSPCISSECAWPEGGGGAGRGRAAGPGRAQGEGANLIGMLTGSRGIRGAAASPSPAPPGPGPGD